MQMHGLVRFGFEARFVVFRRVGSALSLRDLGKIAIGIGKVKVI